MDEIKLDIHNAYHGHTADSVTLTVHELIDKVQISDKVAEAEKAQMLKWVEERYENIDEKITDIYQFIDLMQTELRDVVSPETMVVIVEIIKSFT